MAFIQHVSAMDVFLGRHIMPTPKTVLIQIMDNGHEFPSPRYSFAKTHQFEFVDEEESWYKNVISDAQAKQLVEILQDAVSSNSDVIVHCHAGYSRSSAVAEVGQYLGMTLVEADRGPNQLVKKKMFDVLGVAYECKSVKYHEDSWLTNNGIM